MAMSASLDDDAASTAVAEPTPIAQKKIGKRKRSAEAENSNTASAQSNDLNGDAKKGFDQFLSDVSTLLKKQDPDPSILNHILTPETDSIPSAKRAKLSSQLITTYTIQSKIDSQSYNDIDELSADVAAATQAVVASSLESDSSNAGKFRSFEAYYKALIARQTAQDRDLLRPASAPTTEINGEGEPQIKKDDDLDRIPGSRLVLQSIGPGGRPFFSSIKQDVDALSRKEDGIKDKESLESVLPKSVSAALVGPVQGYDSKSKDHVIPTLGELCPAPSRLPSQKTPQESARGTTRGTTVGWYKTPSFPAPRRGDGKVSYSMQRLSAGSWLTSNKPPPPLNDSVNDRRRQRDRVLSAGTQRVEQTAEELAAARVAEERHQRNKDMTLFRSVYSSFAPTFDNTKSVVPQELTSRMWWNKKQEAEFETFGDPMTDDEQEAEGTHMADGEDQDEEQAFAEAVASFTDDQPQHSITKDESQTPIPVADQDLQELLDETSAMLETLSSYQRRRFGELKASSRPALAEIIGTPSNPAANEIELHGKLRDQLAAVIEMLPPFAVSRLNGDQLNDLNIKTAMTVETAMHKGLLDSETKRVPHPPAGPAVRNPTITPRSASYHQPPATTSGYRSLSSSMPRQPSSVHMGRPLQTPTSSYSSYQPPHQSNSVPRPNYQFVQNSGPRHTPQPNGVRPSSAQHGYGTYGPGTPMQQQPQPGQYQRPPQPNFGSPPRVPQAPAYRSTPGPQPTPPDAAAAAPAVHHGPNAAYGAQAQRPAYPDPTQMPHPQQQYHGPPRTAESAAMSNGFGTIGSQIQLSAEERARLEVSRQNQTEPQSPPQRKSSPNVQDGGARDTPKEPTPMANGHPSSRPSSNEAPTGQRPPNEAASPITNQEKVTAPVKGQGSL